MRNTCGLKEIGTFGEMRRGGGARVKLRMREVTAKRELL